MPWYKTLANYADKMTTDQKHCPDEIYNNGNNISEDHDIKEKLQLLRNDPDTKLLSLVIEKVVIVRVKLSILILLRVQE